MPSSSPKPNTTTLQHRRSPPECPQQLPYCSRPLSPNVPQSIPLTVTTVRFCYSLLPVASSHAPGISLPRLVYSRGAGSAPRVTLPPNRPRRNSLQTPPSFHLKCSTIPAIVIRPTAVSLENGAKILLTIAPHVEHAHFRNQTDLRHRGRVCRTGTFAATSPNSSPRSAPVGQTYFRTNSANPRPRFPLRFARNRIDKAFFQFSSFLKAPCHSPLASKKSINNTALS